jgi:hypothetical protein
MKVTMKKEGKKHLHGSKQHFDKKTSPGNFGKGLKNNLPLVIRASSL